MDIQRLEEFMIIADEQSIRKAAGRLSLPPATLSSRLAVFERDLDTQLFIRERSALSLTDAGNRLYHNGAEILADYHQTLRQMELAGSNVLTELRIGVIGNEMPFHLGPYLDIVNRRNPNIHIDILDESCFSLPDSLLTGEIDLCLGPILTGFRHEDIICQTIAPSHSSVLIPISHALAQSDTISIHQLEGETFILFPEKTNPYIRNFQLANLKDSLRKYDIYDSETGGSYTGCMVPVGKGLLFTPFHDPVHLPHVILRPLTDLPHPAPSSLMYRKNPPRSDLKPLVTDFMRFVKENNTYDY